PCLVVTWHSASGCCSLSLHDALPIYSAASDSRPTEPVMAQALPLSSTVSTAVTMASQAYFLRSGMAWACFSRGSMATIVPETPRSEEHTSELQSRENLVCRLLLEEKK